MVAPPVWSVAIPVPPRSDELIAESAVVVLDELSVGSRTEVSLQVRLPSLRMLGSDWAARRPWPEA